MASRKPPTPFVRRQRDRQTAWRGDRPAGRWEIDGRELPLRWALRADLATETLYPPVRDEVLAVFRERDVAWHEERTKAYGERPPGPSPNLMDSQTFCLNFWEGLAAESSEGLLAALRGLVPARGVEAPVDRVLEPEWIGLENHLAERGRKRRRGQYATSADLLFAWRDEHGRHGLLLESKWSERYDTTSLRHTPWGTDRAAIYRPAVERFQPLTVAFEPLMVDPFDQLLRLQLLGAAMEACGELGFETVSVGWVAPAANEHLWSELTAPLVGGTVPEAWRGVLTRPERFTHASYEALYELAAPHAPAWAAWMSTRYGLGTGDGP